MFILGDILEQVNEWQATLYIHLDFEKLFGSVHKNSMADNEIIWYPGQDYQRC